MVGHITKLVGTSGTKFSTKFRVAAARRSSSKLKSVKPTTMRPTARRFFRRAVVRTYGEPADVVSVERSGCAAMMQPRLSANQIRVRVLASTINPIDAWMARGYGRQIFPLAGVAPPFTTGRDVVGKVVELGPLAWRYSRGDVVVAALHPTRGGAHADFVTCCENGKSS
eukprot:SAG31_NODE_8684_length_1406_cov_1.638868_2_plen_169_part_00